MSDVKLTDRLSNLEARKRDIERAIEAEAALEWLRSCGPRGPEPTKESIGASVSMNYASAVSGAKEAARFLEAAIGAMFAEINEKAIEMAKEAIRRAQAREDRQ